jgi:light-regulated signal transduction histidine kinase (bacteriophytochrome)
MKNTFTPSIIDEQQKTIDALKRSNEHLEHFAYICAHDMRQPLRTISNYMQLIALHHEHCFDATTVEYFDNAIKCVNIMDNLIRNILSYSKSMPTQSLFTHVNLNETLQTIQGNLLMNAWAKDTYIHVNPLPTIYGNPTQMYQLFMNLIDNAIKFKSSAQLILSISAREDADHWIISVADNGIGINQHDKEAVFEMFTCLNQAEHASGSGIGLYICKQIIDRHQGTISIHDNPTGGCVFEITLPKAFDL